MLLCWRMNIGIYSSATALSSLEKWQEATSQNIAASNVPGFKGNQISFESIHAGYTGVQTSSGLVTSASSMPLSSTEFNFGAGQISQTGSSTHLAINGDGFFKIRGDGFEYYTRDGEFHIDGNNELVNKNGDLDRMDSTLEMCISSLSLFREQND